MPKTTRYPEDSAGELMHSEFIALDAKLSAKEAIQHLRDMVEKEVPIGYTYVVDDQGALTGVLNMRDLMFAQGEKPLSEVMTKDVLTVPATLDREELAHMATDHPLLAFPVVDPANKLIGVIPTRDLVSHAQDEATEDIVRMVGASEDESATSSAWFTIRKRFPWLQVNLLTAFLAAFVVGWFEDVIARIAILAVFMPVVAGQAGNAGAQTLAVIIRGLALQEIDLGRAMPILKKEFTAGFVNGALIGAVAGLAAWAWHGNPWLGVVLGAAMIINIILGCVAGVVIPLSMRALGMDPAQSSSIFLTTITDVVGFFTFLGLATLLQGYLV